MCIFGTFFRLAVPVISVGNLTWGGNGKTPMVEFISRHFSDSGILPLILSRVCVSCFDLEAAVFRISD